MPMLTGKKMRLNKFSVIRNWIKKELENKDKMVFQSMISIFSVTFFVTYLFSISFTLIEV